MGTPHFDIERIFNYLRNVPYVAHIVTPPLFPDTIFLFQEPLEEICKTAEDLEQEIEITVVHEIAHALEISEERLEEFGYGQGPLVNPSGSQGIVVFMFEGIRSTLPSANHFKN
jgi:hypothetical protein